MKEASGELSMTAVAVVAIAAIGVVFTTLIWPTIRNNIRRQTQCSSAYGCQCDDNGTCNCFYLDENNNETAITCRGKELNNN